MASPSRSLRILVARGLRIAAGVSALAAGAHSALAADAPAGTAPDRVSAIEDIVVTARKREENLQDTPISMSAFSGDGLEYRGVQSTEALSTVTPNLTLQNNPAFGGSGNSAAIYIRGIGQQDFVPTVDPGVGVYVDGVYIARSIGSILDLVDFERVEVLRGPQGTLFGRNTIGGAISITSKAPEATNSGFASLTYGSDQQVVAKGGFNAAFSDRFALRASAGLFKRDGYVTRVSDGTDLGDADRVAGRIAGRFTPSDSLTVDVAFDFSRSRENGPPVTLLGIAYGNTIAGAPPLADIWNVLANLGAGGGPIPCALPGATSNPAVPGCYDDRWLLGKERNGGTAPAFSKSDVNGASVTVEWQATPSLEFKSISAWRELNGRFSRDGDGSPAGIAAYFDDLDQKQYSQEFQLLGESLDSKLKWILGAYWFKETGRNVNLLEFTVSRFQSGGDFTNRSTAFFGQGTYEITPRLSLTAGLRYTKDRKAFTPDQFIIDNLVPFLPPFDAPFFQPGTRILPFVTAERSFSEVTPMANLSFHATDELMLYANFSRGFKSGGFTQRVFPPIIAGVTAPPTNDPVSLIPAFDPETVDAYELGAKWSGFDDALKVNAAAFYSDYKDLQIQVFTSVAPVFRNAASAEIKGFELETQLSPGAGWYLEAAVGLTDASYKDIDESTTFVPKSAEFERISKWTMSAGISKEIALGDHGTLRPRLDWSHRSRFFNNTFNTPQIAQAAYDTVDANLAWTSPDERWTVLAAVKNLSDERFLLSGVYGSAFQAYEGVWNRGREWSLTIGTKF